MTEIKIRMATEQDAKQLLNIYAPYITHTAITFEYDVPSVEEFQNRIRNIQKKYPYLVAERDGEILGYSYAHEFYGRAAYDWCVETTIYVKMDCKGQGIGKLLYQQLEELLKQMNIINLNSCIAYTEEEDEYLTNQSESFHRHFGYQLVGRFHKCGYKFDRWYDMIWMEKMIGEHSEKPDRVKSILEIL